MHIAETIRLKTVTVQARHRASRSYTSWRYYVSIPPIKVRLARCHLSLGATGLLYDQVPDCSSLEDNRQTASGLLALSG